MQSLSVFVIKLVLVCRCAALSWVMGVDVMILKKSRVIPRLYGSAAASHLMLTGHGHNINMVEPSLRKISPTNSSQDEPSPHSSHSVFCTNETATSERGRI
jgi:cytochrome bd-type quinol oxidase subunit 1